MKNPPDAASLANSTSSPVAIDDRSLLYDEDIVDDIAVDDDTDALFIPCNAFVALIVEPPSIATHSSANILLLFGLFPLLKLNGMNEINENNLLANLNEKKK